MCKIIGGSLVAASLVFISILINGPLTLFPLSFYFLHWFIYRRFSIYYYLKLTFILFVSLIIIAICFFQIFPGAYENLAMYINQQVLSSLMWLRVDAPLTGLAHVKIVLQFISQFIFLFIASLVLIYLFSKNRKDIFNTYFMRYTFENKEALLSLLIAFSATAPIIFSPKQTLHFTLQGGFFFLLAFLQSITPFVIQLLTNINLSFKKYFNIIICLAIFFLLYF